MITVTVAKDFSRHPAGRYLKDGPYTGELFRKKFLEPNVRDHDRVVVVLDGTRGYGSSFLEEAFGGLVRAGFEKATVLQKLELQTSKPSLAQEIIEYIEDAATGKYAAN